MTSVELRNITKRFEQTVALEDVSVHVQSGEMFFLLGPSGCGKSTLLRLIAGLLDPDEGSIWFGERNVTAIRTEKRSAVMCFQSYALWPHMTVADNVRFGLDVQSVSKSEREKRVGEALELVQMADLANRKPNQLSGGQQQRVALARALVVRPACLLLDEPLSNLDAKLRIGMRHEIRRICKETQLTTIYVTHDQKEALSIADHLAILDAGKVMQIGSPQEVYLEPATAFVAGFIGETNLVSARVAATDGDQTVLETPMGTFTSRSTEKWTKGQAVTLSLRPEAIHLGEPPADSPNHFEAAVEDAVYLGEMAQYKVRVGGNEGQPARLKVFELNPRFIMRSGQNTTTSAWIEPQDVVIVRS